MEERLAWMPGAIRFERFGLCMHVHALSWLNSSSYFITIELHFMYGALYSSNTNEAQLTFMCPAGCHALSRYADFLDMCDLETSTTALPSVYP